jgi:hypothetical protein
MLPSLQFADQLTVRWNTIRADTFSLHCKRWSRFFGSSSASLPIHVEFELRGIPIHAWELTTVQQLLNPFAWVQGVHDETLQLKNLDVFRCYGWCYDLAVIPQTRDLWITEPLGTGPGVGRLALAYHVQIKVLVGQRAVPDPTQVPSDLDGSARRRRRFRSRSPPGDSDGRRGSAEDGVHKGRRSALQRLGPGSAVQPREEDLAAVRAHSVLGSSPPQASTDHHLAVLHALDVEVPWTPSEALLFPPVEAVMSTTAMLGAMAPGPEHIQGPLDPVDELGTVEQLAPNTEDTIAVSSIPSANLPLLTWEEGRLGAAVVPDIVPNQGIPHPVERPRSVEPQDAAINSRGGLPSNLQVYFRRKRHTKKCSAPDAPAVSLNDLEKIIKPLVQLLPMPVDSCCCASSE